MLDWCHATDGEYAAVEAEATERQQHLVVH